MSGYKVKQPRHLDLSGLCSENASDKWCLVGWASVTCNAKGYSRWSKAVQVKNSQQNSDKADYNPRKIASADEK